MSNNFAHTILCVVPLFCATACTTAPASRGTPHASPVNSTEQIALDVVARRAAAYNAHDIEAFLATYDDDVRVFEYPQELLGDGRERMRGIFGPQFAGDEGRIIIHSQHALGNVVISDETVTIYGHTEHNIGIYTVRDGLISEVRLIEPEDL